MRARLRKPVVLLILVLFVTLGCKTVTEFGRDVTPTPSPEPTETATPTPPGPPIPPGWTLYNGEDGSFALALPPTWQKIDLDPQTLDSSLAEVRSHNPDWAHLLGEQAPDLLQSGIKFYALEVDSEAAPGPKGTPPPQGAAARFPPNLNVIVQPLKSGETLEAYVQLNRRQMESLEGVTAPVSVRAVKLADEPAQRLRYTMSMGLPGGTEGQLQFTQYFVMQEQKVYVLTFAVQEAQAARYAIKIYQIAESFRFLP